mmetsp:Transcript_26939/g.19387  ORF Transcript_26939/g.19387 Transcript_26939/m.19387 type:complete len:132 (+) Transcript_26939:701-1096(+)
MCRFYFLALVNKANPEQEIVDFMNSSVEELIFNDKEKAAHVNVRFFELYFANLTAENFIKDIYPFIVFSMKRSPDSTLCNVISVVQSLKLSFTEEMVKNLTSEILTTNLLVSEEHYKDSAQLFIQVSKHIK